MKSKTNDTLERTATIINEFGLHARCAGKLARIAERARCGVGILYDGMEADATSVIDILALECHKGSEITVRISDPDDLDVLEDIVGLVQRGFEE